MNITGGRFVITGGASLIGTHVADALLAQGAREVVLLDNFALGTPETARHLIGDDRVKLVRGDILRINELYDAFTGADGVFAIAGFLTLPLTQNPPLGLAVNVEGQVNVFEACRYARVKKVVFSSSIAAYGEPSPGLIDEDSPSNLAPFQPGAMLYSCSKLIGEALCKLYAAKHGVDAVALRYSTVYGERQHYRGVNALYIVENYDKIMRGERPTLPGDGSEVHDYIHVADVARANVMAMASDVSGETFNVVTGEQTTVKRIVEILLEITGRDLQPEYVAAGGAVKSTSGSELNLSRAKIERMLGWRPEVPIEQGLRRLIDWRLTQSV
ncbi:NAD-dependent epimerase/dehydratase family protein [Phenylobacterium sp. LjRoot219]|uniref:NAD-dependent epimerase/dehydratase family protein n=1 Tax=Phenylobacterium sp. LjRoot219 TaxID=3342283 RepID=UPI003ECD919E